MVILEKETFEKFGYYPRDLKPESHKKVLAACDDCGKLKITSKHEYHALCIYCKNKGKRSYNRVPKISRICKTCGKEFKVPARVMKLGTSKYCSRKCQGVVKSKNNSGKNNSCWKGGPVKRVCQECGDIFLIPPSWIKKGRGKYCSKDCSGIVHSKLHKGKNAHNWKGGISFEPYCIKFNKKFKQYIRAKFGNICFLCGKTEEENGQKLSVHHVNYDKNCGCAETEEDKKADDKSCQFIPLCRSCNSKVNKDRAKWEKYFMNKLRNKLNGWCI